MTDPSRFSEANAAELVLWEFSGDDDPDLGHSYSLPTVAQLENGRWAVLFGNGYEDSGAGTAQLFIVFIDGGLDGVWTDGSGATPLDYVKISTNVGSPADRNGLATPAVIDSDGNGLADRVYAGDLRGNLWAFDLSAAAPNAWGLDYAPNPLFTTALGQPLTSQPVPMLNPRVHTSAGNSPNVLLLFGSGQFLVDADRGTTATQSLYGVWDAGSGALTNSDLTVQQVDSGLSTVDLRVVSDNPVDYGTAKGWRLDLPAGGERLIAAPEVRLGTAYFNTVIPNDQLCEYGGGGWLMAIDAATGGQPASPPFDLNGDDTVDPNADRLAGDVVSGQRYTVGMPAGPALLGERLYTPGSDSNGPNGSQSGGPDDDGAGVGETALPPYEGVPTGRLSWEQRRDGS